MIALPETQALLRAFETVQLDMWSDSPLVTPSGEATTVRQWARTLGINYAPTIVFFDAQGQEVIRSEAFFKSFHVQSMMDYVASRGYEQESNFQRYISERADHMIEEGKDVNIWQ